MLDAGFHPEFPPQILSEVQSLAGRALTGPPPGTRDLRALLWSSIDNDNSRDLDQIEFTESLADGVTRLLVGIADVDTLVPKGSATDAHAAAEATSVYTGVCTFPMLPPELSTGMTSLLNGGDRCSVVMDLQIAPSGEVVQRDVFLALVRNAAKLTYSAVGAWLEGRAAAPPDVANTPGLEAQLRLQQATAVKLRALRAKNGALAFESSEATPVLENGTLTGLTMSEEKRRRGYHRKLHGHRECGHGPVASGKGALSLRRVVRIPKRWDRIQAIAAQFGTPLPAEPDPRALSQFLAQRKAADPGHFPDLSLAVVKLLGPGEYLVEKPGDEHQGHFGLAAQDYTHSTAPTGATPICSCNGC